MNRALQRRRIRVAGGGGGGGGGSYSHLAPAYTLPYTEAGTPMTYNSTTGLTEGTVFATEQFTRAYLVANVVTVKTVKASGGDYTPSQYQTALNDAATANVFTVIVVDAGLVLQPSGTAVPFTLPVKSGTAAWCFTVSAPWWSAAWAPSGQRYLNVDTEMGNTFTIRQSVQAPGQASAAIQAIADGADRYGFIGCKIERYVGTTIDLFNLVTIENGSATTVAQLPQEHLFQWCWIDGVWKQSSTYYPTRRGIQADGYKLAFVNSVATGFAGTGSDPQAIVTFNGGGRIKVVDSLLEGAGENFMSGGAQPNPNFIAADMEFRRMYCTARQHWNPSSSLWDAGAPSPIRKNPFEIKIGERILLEGCVLENSWAQAQDGPGIVLKCSADPVSTRKYAANNITVRLCKVLNTGNSIFYSSSEYISTASWAAGSSPLGRVDITGSLFEMGLRTQLNSPSARTISLQQNGSATDPLAQPYGASTIHFNTFVRRDTGPVGNLLLSTDYAFSAFDLSDNVFDPSYDYGISTNSTVTDTAALAAVNIAPARNVWRGGTWLTRSNFASTYPSQYTAALWVADRVGIGFVDHTAKNYQLAVSSPVKGLASGGKDPGADFTLLDAVTSGVRNAPSFLITEFV